MRQVQLESAYLVATMKTFDGEDRVTAMWVRIPNTSELGAPLPTVDVPASWDYPDDEDYVRIPAPRRAVVHAKTRRRRKDVWPVLLSYAATVLIWVALGVLIGSRI